MLFPELRLYPSSQLYPGMPLPRTPTAAVFAADVSVGAPAPDDVLAALAALLSQTNPAPDSSRGAFQLEPTSGIADGLSTRADLETSSSEASIIG